MFRFDVLVGEWPGIVEDECSMCLCRDEESERVRKRSPVRERKRSERGEERRVAGQCCAGTQVFSSSCE
jgi:hypothetical protein